MPRHGRQRAGRLHSQHPHHGGNADERQVPAPVLRQNQPQGHTRHRGHGKRRHHDAHGTPAPLKGHHVRHDGLRQGRQHAAKSARKNARHRQRAIGGREAAGQRRQPEQAIEHQQQPLAPEAVDVGRSQQARCPRRQRVGRHQQAKLRVRDRKQLRELRAQRHHDHEVQDVCELDAGQRQQQPQFTAGRKLRGSRRHSKRPSRPGQVQGRPVCRKPAWGA